LLSQGIVGTQQESVFQQTVLGLFLSTLSSESKEPSTEFIRQLSQHIFAAELARNPPVDVARHSRDGRSPPLSVLTSSYLEAVSLALADFPTASAKEGEVLVSLVVDDILGEMAKVPSGGSEEKPEAPILDALGSKFSSLCFEEPWKRKLAGCTGIHVLTSKPGLGVRWIIDRQLDFLRPLLFILKDMPNDPPQTVSFIIDVITEILRLCNGDTSLGVPQRAKVVQTLIRELASTNPVVRETAQSSIALLAELTSTSVPDLLSPVANASLLTPIFDKPLRALPFAMQIGNLEAVTYCLNLRPSLPEVNEQLVRLLSEAIALADAEDQALIGRAPQHRHEVSLRNLRISCLRLLSAAMACTDFFAKQSNVRSRYVVLLLAHTSINESRS
jgi:transformation/transcription domain-associated protein